jgi:hypothetical protein
MVGKEQYKSFFNAIYAIILKKEKSNKRSIEKLASSFGIQDKNTIKEITEAIEKATKLETKTSSNKGKVLRLRAKAISIKQKQLLLAI